MTNLLDLIKSLITNKNHILPFFITFILCFIPLTIKIDAGIQGLQLSYLYLSYAPNIYRLQTQLLIYIAKSFPNISFLYYYLSFMIFTSSILIIQFLLHLTNKELFIYWLFLIQFSFVTVFENSLMYLLLFIIVRYKKPIIMPLVVVVKEFALWQIFGYYIIYKNKLYPYIIYFIIGIIIYFGIKTIMGFNSHDYSNLISIFGFYYTPEVILNFFTFTKIFFSLILLLSIFLCIDNRKDFLLFVWNFFPIIFFGLFWEIQLWFPIALLILTERYNESINGNAEIKLPLSIDKSYINKKYSLITKKSN